jgi:uncharacterized protein Yka (UPF0111/DUF47 family)
LAAVLLGGGSFRRGEQDRRVSRTRRRVPVELEPSPAQSTEPPKTEKDAILRELGIEEFLLPKLISEALVANDRAKYFLTLLQSARDHADAPDEPFSNLQNERLLSGVDDATLDGVVEGSKKLDDGRYEILSSARVALDAVANTEKMINALRAAGGEYAESQAEFSRRLVAIGGGLKFEDEKMDGQSLTSLLSAEREKQDSLHLVVMDLHKTINALQIGLYQESVEGARVYGIDDHDRELVRAFMNGVNKTAGLKFDHPGLETSATRRGDTLLIENNVGVTDAHIIVLKIRDKSVSITYTDVHPQRLFFLHSMMERFDVRWSQTSERKGKVGLDSVTYHCSLGVFDAADERTLEEYLAYLGSRIVFLIDWNKARKQLKEFLNNKATLAVLKWSADNNVGHCGFLRMGGAQLVYGALEQGARGVPLRYGVKLAEILETDKASDFLKFCLKTCSEGLLSEKSEFLIRDEIRVELAKYFHSLYEDLLGIAADHATIVTELAKSVREGLVQARTGEYEALRTRAEKGKRWETEADALLNKTRQITKRTRASPAFERMMSNSDDAADALEEALFLLTLISGDDLSDDFFEPMIALADSVCRCSVEHLRALENAKSIRRWSSREDLEEFLQAVDAVLDMEHEADDKLRNVSGALLKKSKDFRQLHSLSEISGNAEDSTDSMMMSATVLKDYVLEEMMAS